MTNYRKPFKLFTTTAVAALVCGAVATTAFADEVPPQGSKMLSEILSNVESDAGTIIEAEFDDGFWELTAHKNRQLTVYHVDPKTGDVKKKRMDDDDEELPPSDAMKLSELAEKLEGSEPGTITSIEFDEGVFEVEMQDGDDEVEFDVDPKTGERVD
jgi:uncharacterized membrane protein YkoI